MERDVPVVLRRSRLLFTCRNQAAEGLRLANITNYCVGSLPEDAAERVLLADGVQLGQEQLRTALDFCGGLPLALTLLHGALHGAQRAGGADPVLQRIKASGNISCDRNDKLWEALRFSVECLSQELQITWLDLVQVFDHKRFSHINGFTSDVPLQKLQCLFGEEHLQDLKSRNLVVFKQVAWHVGPHVEVVVHDVLLCMADHMCGPDSEHYHYTAPPVLHTAIDDTMPLPIIKVRIPCFHHAQLMACRVCTSDSLGCAQRRGAYRIQ
jgi:hypothetical protein